MVWLWLAKHIGMWELTPKRLIKDSRPLYFVPHRWIQSWASFGRRAQLVWAKKALSHDPTFIISWDLGLHLSAPLFSFATCHLRWTNWFQSSLVVSRPPIHPLPFLMNQIVACVGSQCMITRCDSLGGRGIIPLTLPSLVNWLHNHPLHIYLRYLRGKRVVDGRWNRDGATPHHAQHQHQTQ